MVDAVFVVYRDDGYEGCSKPLRAFSTEALANLYIAGAEYYSSNMKVVMLDLETPEHFSLPSPTEEKAPR